MRTIPANTLTQIAEHYANEPINIVSVAWDGSVHWYADKDVESIDGKITSISDMETVINISGSSDSEEISIILSDTDGTIKTLMDNNDVHKVDAWVYQYFNGMTLDDKFLLFKGKVNSPITWSEGTRRVSFNIVSRLEDEDVGFSAEEGQFESVADELIGQPWPLVFGNVTGVRALRTTRVGTAITGQGISLPDVTLLGRIEALRINEEYQWGLHVAAAAQANYYLGQSILATQAGDTTAAAAWTAKMEAALLVSTNARINAINFGNKKDEVQDDYNAQVANGWSTSVDIIDSDSPILTGTVRLKIGGAVFTGTNSGSTITFDSHNIAWYVAAGTEWFSVSNYGWVPRELTEEPLNLPRATGTQFIVGTDSSFVPDGNITGTSLGYFYANAGTTIEVITAEQQEYVISIVPGTVTRVSAYYNNNGLRVLRVVPTDYYTVETRDYGAISAVILTTTDALSKLGNWEDQIFVDFESTVGPNTVDIMEYLITNYSSLTYDITSFNSVKAALENYPSHFALYERKDILTLLKEIAWQCRCSIRLVNDVFFLTYLSTTPTIVDTIVETDILVDSLELGYTQTEDLTTKMLCTWESTGAQEEKHRVILKNNVAKYGVQENAYNFYIYNYLDAVIKSATFWLIRYSNTWRKAVFTTPITKLNIETLDAVSLDVSFVSSNPVKAVVESAIYDSTNDGISFELWLPILAGTNTEYVFAFPATADSTETFQADVEDPQPFNIGSQINFNRAANDPYSLKSTGGDRRFSSLGSRYPSDVGDTTPNLETKTRVPAFKVLPTQGIVTPSYTQVELIATEESIATTITEIDIHTTIISDSTTGKTSTLSTFFDRIADVGGTDTLIVSSTHSVVGEDDDTNEQTAQFHYRYYATGSTWGAGTAFLRT